MKVERWVVDNQGQSIKKYVQEIFDILHKYWEMAQRGTDRLVIPDPFFVIDREEVEYLISEIDDDFRYELFRIPEQCDVMPEFHRLVPNAQLGMVQEIKKKRAYQKEHPEEYYEEVSNIIKVPNPYSNIQFEYHEEGYLTPIFEEKKWKTLGQAT